MSEQGAKWVKWVTLIMVAAILIRLALF